MAAPYEGMYGKLKFPNYVHQEFPKVVQSPSGSPMIVNNKREELEAASNRSERPSDDAIGDLASDRDGLATLVSEKDAEINRLQKQLLELTAKVGGAMGGAQQVPGSSRAGGSQGSASDTQADSKSPAAPQLNPGAGLSKEFPGSQSTGPKGEPNTPGGGNKLV